MASNAKSKTFIVRQGDLPRLQEGMNLLNSERNPYMTIVPITIATDKVRKYFEAYQRAMERIREDFVIRDSEDNPVTKIISLGQGKTGEEWHFGDKRHEVEKLKRELDDADIEISLPQIAIKDLTKHDDEGLQAIFSLCPYIFTELEEIWGDAEVGGQPDAPKSRRNGKRKKTEEV